MFPAIGIAQYKNKTKTRKISMQQQKLRKQKMVAFQDKRHEIRILGWKKRKKKLKIKKNFYVNKCKIKKTVRNEKGYKKSENFQKTC